MSASVLSLVLAEPTPARTSADSAEARNLVALDMFISLSTLAHPGERHEGWVAEVKRDLSPAMREEADYFHSLFENRLVELAVDYPDHFDVEGFFRYLETMATEDFIFYATGRVMSPTEIANMASHPLRLLAALLKLAKSGIRELRDLQKKTLAKAWPFG